MDCRRVSGEEGDLIRDNYVSIQESPAARTLLRSFDKHKDRLDQLFLDVALTVKVSSAFRKFTNLILVNFHGNASVERGFSVNKHCLADNLLEQNLVARRMVCEQVGLAGAPEKVDLNNSLILSCKNSNARWKESLKRKRDEIDSSNSEEGKRRKLMLDIASLCPVDIFYHLIAIRGIFILKHPVNINI